MFDIDRSRKAIREEGLSAWLFSNAFHRDQIADLVLDVPAERMNTRPWVCVVSIDRPTVKIVHRIESGILDHIPGETITYYMREQLKEALARSLPVGGRVGADYSIGIPIGSFLDHGTALLLESVGAELAPAEGLVARYLGTIDDEGKRSHDAAAAVLYAAVARTWSGIREAMRQGRSVTEGEARDWILAAFAAGGLETDDPPIVGAGSHSNDPHFTIEGNGAVLARGDVVQFDIWAREKTPGAVYADISWVGVCDAEPSMDQRRLFEAVRDAREAAVTLLERRFSAGTAVRGADVDRAARAVLIERGFERYIRHRTGHSIGEHVHGFGVNLDSVEFPDERLLTEGSCFSIEPGIYLEDYGMRTEIDCVIQGGRPVITGAARQRDLLTFA
jgi:Xaa-Pro dipeptidase